MEHKKKVVKLLLISALVFGVGYAFVNPLQFGICRSTYTYGGDSNFVGCLDDTDQRIGAPLIFFFPLVFLISLLLYFLPAEIFHSWWRFARWYFGFSAMLFTLIFFSDSSGGGELGGPSAEEFWPPFLAILFFLISLAIILKKWRMPDLSGKMFIIRVAESAFQFAVVAFFVLYAIAWIFNW
jgi:hypothetical protein